jgi:hypothetical protein
LEENWAAFDISLTDGKKAEIRGFLAIAELAEPPAPAAFASSLFRDTKEESG